MKVRTIQILTTPRGIIPAGQVLDIPGNLFRKLQGKVEPIPEEEENVTKKDQGWQGKMKELIGWFLNASLPETPFNLNPWTRVVDPKKFYAGLREDINVGPKGSRGRRGLECDLIDLKRVLH